MNKLNDKNPELETRRSFMLNSLALVVTATAATNVFSSESAKGDHHHHHGHGSKQHKELVESALHCIQTAQYCRDHCIQLIKGGDTTLADCLQSVNDTIPMCETLVQLSTSNNRHLKSFAKVCIRVCRDCEKECEPHKDKHKECEDCMLSCRDCIEHLEKLIA